MFNPCTRKSANMGHPPQGKAWWEAGKVEDEMTAAPQIDLKSFISLLTRPRKSAPRDDKGEGGDFYQEPLDRMDGKK